MFSTNREVKDMYNKENKRNCICTQCEFCDTKTDSCTENDIKECSKQNITECENFLVKDKLVHF